MACEFKGLSREFRAMYQQQENLVVLLKDVSRTIPYVIWRAKVVTSGAQVQSPWLVGWDTSGAMVTWAMEGAAVVTTVIVVSVACTIDT